MTDKEDVMTAIRRVLERNGGPIGGYIPVKGGEEFREDAYVMVKREDFDALAALTEQEKGNGYD